MRRRRGSGRERPRCSHGQVAMGSPDVMSIASAMMVRNRTVRVGWYMVGVPVRMPDGRARIMPRACNTLSRVGHRAQSQREDETKRCDEGKQTLHAMSVAPRNRPVIFVAASKVKILPIAVARDRSFKLRPRAVPPANGSAGACCVGPGLRPHPFWIANT